jgi:hypothetical protein
MPKLDVVHKSSDRQRGRELTSIIPSLALTLTLTLARILLVLSLSLLELVLVMRSLLVLLRLSLLLLIPAWILLIVGVICRRPLLMMILLRLARRGEVPSRSGLSDSVPIGIECLPSVWLVFPSG